MSLAEPLIPTRPTPDGRPRQIGLIADDYTQRMLMAAGLPRGHQFHVLDPGAPDLSARAQALDLVLCDPGAAPRVRLERLAQTGRLLPGGAALALGRDRLQQRLLLEQLDIPTYPLFPVDSRNELCEALARLGRPAVLKPRDPCGSRRSVLLEREADLQEGWLLLGGEPLVLEPLLPVREELALTAVRGATGEVAYYALAERHAQRPDFWIAPAASASNYQTEAASLAGRVLRRLAYVGVLTLRFFVTDRRLVAAEITPGCHPAGYWTVEGAFTSQYENALRAVLGQPLGTVSPRGHTATLGLSFAPDYESQLLEVGGTQLHLHARDTAGETCHGHVAVQGADLDRLNRRLAEVLTVARVG